ncbi:MAG: hypothetical protein M3340_06940, partial [Actinomycetota bacterium]|nr:hypothetical protein [Actinomycetota bacterium]
MLKVWLLGPARFDVDGRAAEPSGTPSARLLAYLALSPGRSHGKSALAQQLWGLRGAEENLRKAIASLRRDFGDPDTFARYVDSKYGTIALRAEEPGTLWVDAEEFDRLRHSDPEQALELARGDFLEQFTDAGDWVEQRRRRYAQRVSETWTAAIEQRWERGDATAAVALAERRLDAVPDDQAALRAYMRVQAEAGQPEAALAAYEEHMKPLRDRGEAVDQT